MRSLKPSLPHDILRIIFEHAALDDRRTALRVNAAARVELILYSIVNLHRETTCRAFLRTIETSRTKSRAFFATNVKSLCISYDVYNDRTARIITACRGVTSLTFWVIPTTWHTSSTTRLSHHEIDAALDPLRPKKLSVLLHGVFGFPHPRFHLSFFQKITHLSVVNKWEDWTTWRGFELLQCLTHLSLDLRVGSRFIDERTAYAIANTLHTILARCPKLRVCILLLIFDSAPSYTATAVVDTLVCQAGSNTPDARLVFMHDSEPFLDREAHSIREARIWKMAEQTVAIQSSGGGFWKFENPSRSYGFLVHA
ncbi:hypothetical protein DXG03_009680 [Asterophora parasitica]|uniref:Uncharacterized protein n=1 Tax=Asterophora parasitica TaxID=117018 RepID=A0A9P7G5Z3_9AGAR|nr:hypothetical protein DXG03_009680 [Asterophora parasitica]